MSLRCSLTAAFLAGALLAACEAATPPTKSPDPPLQSRSASPPAAPAHSTQVKPDNKAVVDEVLADASRRTRRAVGELKVVSNESVTWPDGSLGCPEPGMAYTMALVPGYRIVIDADGERLVYHTSRRGYFVLCPASRAVGPASGSSS